MHERDYYKALLIEHCNRHDNKLIPTRFGFKYLSKPKEQYEIQFICKKVADTITQEKLEQNIVKLSAIYPNVTGKPYKYSKYNSKKIIEKEQDYIYNEVREREKRLGYFFDAASQHIHGKGYDNEN